MALKNNTIYRSFWLKTLFSIIIFGHKKNKIGSGKSREYVGWNSSFILFFALAQDFLFLIYYYRQNNSSWLKSNKIEILRYFWVFSGSSPMHRFIFIFSLFKKSKSTLRAVKRSVLLLYNAKRNYFKLQN